MSIPHIIIIGGGAGGLELATQLGNKIGRSKRAKITLIDNRLTHIWKPLLHEIAAGTLYAQDVELSYLAHAKQHHFHFQLGTFEKLNRKAKKITVSPVYDDEGQMIIAKREITYDYLVIAVGSTSNDFGVQGVKKQCFFLDDYEQAEAFHKNFLCRWLDLISQPKLKRDINIVIVGGGATGVELAAELRGMIQDIIKYTSPYPKLIKHVKISLLEATSRLVPFLPETLSEKVTKVLENMHVKVYTNESVKRVTETEVVTHAGLVFPADLVVWAAGIKAPDLLCHLDGLVSNQRCQLIVRKTLQTTKDPSIFAFGDCAACPIDEKNWVPPRAQAAHQQGVLLAKSLANLIAGKTLLDYEYRDYGSLVSISNNAVGNLMRILARDWMIEGKLAKWVYLSLYQKHLIALHGFWRSSLTSVLNLFGRKVKPKLKLH